MDWFGLTVKQLRRAMQHRKIRPGKRRKAELVSALTRHDAARRLQRWRRAAGPPPCNDNDPLTLQLIWRRHSDAGTLFSYTTDAGQRVVNGERRVAREVGLDDDYC